MSARILLLAALAASASMARAQLQVEIVDTQPDYLLYEPVMLKIRIVNGTGRMLELDQSNGKSWLRFLVTKGDALMVRPAKEFLQPRVVLEAGDQARFSFNLTPFYSFREIGGFMVQAVVRVPGMPGDVMSRPVRFNVMHGHPVWTKELTPTGVAGPRRYSLLTHLVRDSRQNMDRPHLYAQVESESENTVFICRQLGPLMQGERVESMFDSSFGWHVLFRSSAKDFYYYQFDIEGRQVERKELAKAETRPHLVPSGGDVNLVGGANRADMEGGDTLSGSQPAEVLQPGRGSKPNATPPSPEPAAPRK